MKNAEGEKLFIKLPDHCLEFHFGVQSVFDHAGIHSKYHKCKQTWGEVLFLIDHNSMYVGHRREVLLQVMSNSQ